jgi:hypothetical protein
MKNLTMLSFDENPVTEMFSGILEYDTDVVKTYLRANQGGRLDWSVMNIIFKYHPLVVIFGNKFFFRIWNRKLEVQDDVSPLFDLAESDIFSYQEIIDKFLQESKIFNLRK